MSCLLVVTYDKIPDVFIEKITEFLDDTESTTTVGNIHEYNQSNFVIAYVQNCLVLNIVLLGTTHLIFFRRM